jgi:hypothetical protein
MPPASPLPLLLPLLDPLLLPLLLPVPRPLLLPMVESGLPPSAGGPDEDPLQCATTNGAATAKVSPIIVHWFEDFIDVLLGVASRADAQRRIEEKPRECTRRER